MIRIPFCSIKSRMTLQENIIYSIIGAMDSISINIVVMIYVMCLQLIGYEVAFHWRLTHNKSKDRLHRHTINTYLRLRIYTNIRQSELIY